MNNEIQTIQKLLEKHNYIEAEKQAALLTNRFPKNLDLFKLLGYANVPIQDTQAIKVKAKLIRMISDLITIYLVYLEMI